MNAPQILGLSDEVTTCDCCGRGGLKRTIRLGFDDGEEVFYGTTCASRAFALGTGAQIADTAARMCSCGCGEFANRITPSGRRFRADHLAGVR